MIALLQKGYYDCSQHKVKGDVRQYYASDKKKRKTPNENTVKKNGSKN
jgi:hypothetical protein